MVIFYVKLKKASYIIITNYLFDRENSHHLPTYPGGTNLVRLPDLNYMRQ